MKKFLVFLFGVWFLVSVLAQQGPRVRLKIAHNLAEDHPWGVTLEKFAKDLAAETNGRVTSRVYHNSVLGSGSELIEQVQRGIIAVNRTSAAVLSNVEPYVTAFSLPYIFESEDEFYTKLAKVVDDKLWNVNDKFVILGAFTGGIRSFYTKKPVYTVEDLAGLKIRVMDSPTQIRMLDLLGGTPTPMAYGEIYSALQQGVIDGAENNPTALTLSRHGEVAKYYTYDRHGFIPDFVIMSRKFWDQMDSNQQQAVRKVTKELITYHRNLWDQTVKKSIEEAKKLGVTFIEPDQKPFRDKVLPMYDSYRKQVPEVEEILTLLENY